MFDPLTLTALMTILLVKICILKQLGVWLEWVGESSNPNSEPNKIDWLEDTNGMVLSNMHNLIYPTKHPLKRGDGLFQNYEYT